MDTGRAFWVICITLVAIIIINVGIVAAFSKRKPDSLSSTFGKAVREMRNPREQLEAEMTELSERIAELRNKTPPDQEGTEKKGNQDTYG